MKEFIEFELILLWDSLWEAEDRSRSSNPDRPSIEMENIMERIVWATSLVGPVSWKEINLRALETGRYEHWAKYMEIEYEPPKLEKVMREVDEAL